MAIDVAGGNPLHVLFFDEARKQLDREGGQASLTTTQALYMMYLYCVGTAKDRIALMYRFAGAEMYKRMKSGLRIPRHLSTDETDHHRKLWSRHVWGTFSFEVFALAYVLD